MLPRRMPRRSRPDMAFWDKYENVIRHTDPLKYEGTVRRVVGLTIEANGPMGQIGEVCLLHLREGV